MKKKIIYVLIIIFLLIAFGATVTIDWLYDTFGHLSFDEIVFHIKVPMQGTNTDIVFQFMEECLLKVIIPTATISIILIYPMVKNLKFIDSKIHTAEKRRTIVISFSVSIIILAFCIARILNTTDILAYIENQLQSSTFIADEYVKPEETKIEFKDEKRNLIYIFLESMETTYHSKANGGLSEKELMPELAKLAEENVNFTNTENIGGAIQLTGTSWTVGAMTAQTAGVPLKLKIDGNSLGDYSIFLGGAYGIGEILEDNGYQNFLLLGSEATFGGRKNLFEQHGNYEIWDFNTALEEKRVSEKNWWGFTDDKLFEYSKEKILELAKSGEPFNFTTLTTDTHFPDGFKCEDCKDEHDMQYENAIACSSRRVMEFVEWIKKQDFYDNTTIVIVGDHLTMQKGFFELEKGQDYKKKVVSIIINPAVEATNTENRLYSTIDLYPTTLAALGATIEGDRLALGTNLFSDEKTLIEKYGLEYVNKELYKDSKFYNNNILVKNK